MNGCILFDWGDTLMRDFKEFHGPMKDWPCVEAVAGAGELLSRLNPDWTLALATNAVDSDEADIRAALLRADLDRWLARVYCFKQIGYRKPSLEFFQFLLDDLKVTPARACMVGDLFEVDVLGANACGIRAIWFNEWTDEVRQGALHRTIHALRELPEALKDLMPVDKG
jgi:FMN phosphatase YigB (HAD superfamily)